MKIFKLIILLTVLAVSAPGIARAQAQPNQAAATEQKKVKNVKPEEFDKLRQDKKNVVLDVRSKAEYEKGHIAGTKLIDFNGDDFEKELAKLDKSKTYLVHCASGGRSAAASEKMKELKFAEVYNLEGGIKAWEKAGKPVKKD